MSVTIQTTSIDGIVKGIVKLVTDRNVHKLAGTALASFGFTSGSHLDLIVGSAYASLMHLTGGIKKVVDSLPLNSPKA